MTLGCLSHPVFIFCCAGAMVATAPPMTHPAILISFFMINGYCLLLQSARRLLGCKNTNYNPHRKQNRQKLNKDSPIFHLNPPFEVQFEVFCHHIYRYSNIIIIFAPNFLKHKPMETTQKKNQAETPKKEIVNKINHDEEEYQRDQYSNQMQRESFTDMYNRGGYGY